MLPQHLLAVDVGNTQTVLGIFREGKLERTWRISTHPIGTADEFRAKFYSLASGNLAVRQFGSQDTGIGTLESGNVDVVISSVVPAFTAVLREAFRGWRTLHFVDHTSPFSFRIKADPPQQVGADRLVNAEAVARKHDFPAIIVDSGTATTLCALSRDGEYLGGAIMPGIELSVETLARRAAQLFSVELSGPAPTAIGTNTRDALRSGILLGYAEMVDGMIERFKTELADPKARVIATGGVSQLLKPLLKHVTHYDSELTLKGIAYIHEALRTR